MSNKQIEMMAREHEFDPEAAKEVVQVMADAAVAGYKMIEDGVVTGYKKVETGAVEGFGKVVNKCVEVLFAKEGESVEDAKNRLSGNQK